MWTFPQKNINLLQIHERYIVSLLKTRSPPLRSFFFLFFSSGVKFELPKIRARENDRFKPHLLLSIPAVSNKKVVPGFFFKLKEKKNHAKTRENSKFVKHDLWVSLVFQEIREIIKTCSKSYAEKKRASKSQNDTPMLLTQWPLLTHFLDNRCRCDGVKNINQPYLSEKNHRGAGVRWMLVYKFPLKNWKKSFHWKFWSTFVTFSCFFGNFGFELTDSWSKIDESIHIYIYIYIHRKLASWQLTCNLWTL